MNMDFREYWLLLKKEYRFFWVIVLGLWLLSALWLTTQPVRYQGTLLLNVGRTASEASAEYSYDSFYRLQADERFADTLVRWLANPRIVSDILASAGTTADFYTEQSLTRQFQAKRLSSQVVEVRYGAATREALEKYAEAIIGTTQKYTESLNGTQVNWFRVVGSDPVIRDARIPAWPFLLISLAAALFIAFWAVLIKHYCTPDPEKHS
jgi:uncharacterized protein involved in exopolysaccharide biosynthesis